MRQLSDMASSAPHCLPRARSSRTSWLVSNGWALLLSCLAYSQPGRRTCMSPSAGRRACSPDCCSPELSVQGRRNHRSGRSGRQRRRHHLPLFDCCLSDRPWRTRKVTTRTGATVAQCRLREKRHTNASSRRLHSSSALFIQRISGRDSDFPSSAVLRALILRWKRRVSSLWMGFWCNPAI